jgi:hypothetical protein
MPVENLVEIIGLFLNALYERGGEMSTREYVMVVSEMSRMMHDGLIDEEDAANETF